ncbi:MAG: hypothetical protein IT375_31890 [Polyangiaceae bacterium]|nr:hypothetical protein [Polyangiaceae bacterium]
MSRSRREQKPGLFDGDFGSEHQAHHTDTRYFTPTERKVKAAAVALGALGTLGSLAFGPAFLSSRAATIPISLGGSSARRGARRTASPG